MKKKEFRLIAGHILVILPPLFGIYVLLKPEAFFYGFSPNAPYVIAATLALVAVMFMVCAFGYYLLKKEQKIAAKKACLPVFPAGGALLRSLLRRHFIGKLLAAKFGL